MRRVIGDGHEPLERVEADKWGTVLKDDETTERREFIRAIDAVKKRTQRARKFAALTSDVPEYSNRTENSVRDDRDAVAKVAREMLSPRQRRIRRSNRRCRWKQQARRRSMCCREIDNARASGRFAEARK